MYKRTYIHTYIHANIHTYIQTYIHKYIQKPHTSIHTHMHSIVHASRNTYISEKIRTSEVVSSNTTQKWFSGHILIAEKFSLITLLEKLSQCPAGNFWL